MGDRYILEMKCPECGFSDKDVYFAPTCGFTTWKCECGLEIDLCAHTGISFEEASNAALIAHLCAEIEGEVNHE